MSRMVRWLYTQSVFKVDIDQGRTGALVRGEITEIKKLSIDSPIKMPTGDIKIKLSVFWVFITKVPNFCIIKKHSKDDFCSKLFWLGQYLIKYTYILYSTMFIFLTIC